MERRGEVGCKEAAAAAQLWSATPESLRRIGLRAEGSIDDARDISGDRELKQELLCRLEEVFAVLRAELTTEPGAQNQVAFGNDGKTSQSEGDSEDPARPVFPEQVRSAGDRLLVLVRDVASADDGARWAKLRISLMERNFLRSWLGFDAGNMAGALGRTLAGTGLGCRVQVSASLLEALANGTAEAAMVSCRSRAHLALTQVAERTPGFRAESLGRVLGARRFEVQFEGSGLQGVFGVGAEAVHPMSQQSG